MTNWPTEQICIVKNGGFESAHVKCSCSCSDHDIILDVDNDEGWCVTIWTSLYSRANNWKERFKLAWKLLKSGELEYQHDIMLSADGARNVARYLLQAADRMENHDKD